MYIKPSINYIILIIIIKSFPHRPLDIHTPHIHTDEHTHTYFQSPR